MNVPEKVERKYTNKHAPFIQNEKDEEKLKILKIKKDI